MKCRRIHISRTAIGSIRAGGTTIKSGFAAIGSGNGGTPSLAAYYPGAGRSKTTGKTKATWRVRTIGNRSTVTRAAAATGSLAGAVTVLQTTGTTAGATALPSGAGGIYGYGAGIANGTRAFIGVGYAYGKSLARGNRRGRYGKGIGGCRGGGASNVPGLGVGSGGAAAGGGGECYAAAGTDGSGVGGSNRRRGGY